MYTIFVSGQNTDQILIWIVNFARIYEEPILAKRLRSQDVERRTTANLVFARQTRIAEAQNLYFLKINIFWRIIFVMAPNILIQRSQTDHWSEEIAKNTYINGSAPQQPIETSNF